MDEKWEYKTFIAVDFNDQKDVTAALNHLGIFGWEAVGITHVGVSKGCIILLKRKKLQ